MAPITNGRVLFNEIPQGYPELGKTLVYDETETIDLDSVPLDGGYLVKLLALSIDPFMRMRMRDPSQWSYTPAYRLGEPILGFGVGVVLRSEHPQVSAGDHIEGLLNHKQYDVRKDVHTIGIINNPRKLPWSLFIGVLGMPGMTAYMAWKEYSQAKPGETVFVSAGAGTVGSLVIQIAKAEGLKVIASAGSHDKVQFMKDCGADVAFNYKEEDVHQVLSREGPINIYWDNVGGESLDAALASAAPFARFIVCGMISGYNSSGYNFKNLSYIFGKSITIHGFLVFNLMAKYRDAFFIDFSDMVASGKLKHREETFSGLAQVEAAVVAVQKGETKGHAIVTIAEE